MWAGAAVALAVAAGSAFMIPAAVGASPHAKTGSAPLCTATGKIPLGNAGAISLTAKGKGISGTGTPTSCTVKMKGNWKKNSTAFSFDTTTKATLGKGGTLMLDPTANLSPFVGKVSGALVGSGLSTGAAMTIEIHCWLSYPPLKYGCEIIIHSATASGAPRHTIGAIALAVPQAKTGSAAPLCTATGTKPMGNTGVVNVTLKGSGKGTPIVCGGTMTGKWVKNSTTFSFGSSSPATLGQGGAFRAKSAESTLITNGRVVGTLTGSGLPTGANLTIDMGCSYTYPPLKIKCWIIISAA